MANNTAFPLGVFVGNPDKDNPVANATFESTFQTFETAMGGAKPAFMDAFTDFFADPSQWGANAAWGALSWAQTGNAFVGPGSGVTPVVGVPLASNAGGWSNVDTFYKAIIAGTYDADYQGIVDAWAAQGYTTIQLRIAYEFDGNFMPWAPGNSSSPTANADFIAAWQHVANLVHAEGQTDHITVQTVWNPADINWAATPPAQLYPGDQYVDIISTDVYSPTYPLDLTNWSVSNTAQLSSATAWAAIAANRDHFWQYTDGTQYHPTGNGSGWSMADAIAFTAAHNKPLSISETGAGGNGAAEGPVDDPAFPQWLAGALAQAQVAGVTVQNVDIWATDQSDGGWGFLNGERPAEAAAWSKYFGAGSATPRLAVSAPGSAVEASVGAGVTVPLIVTGTNLSGGIYDEVLTASGSVETAYAAALPIGAAITVPTTIPQQKANQGFSVQVAFNYVPNHANLKYSSVSGGVSFSTFASNAGIAWDASGQIATIPILNGNPVPHFFQVEDTTTATPLRSVEVAYQVGASGDGGTIMVTPPTIIGTTETFFILPHLAHSGDTVQVANSAASPTVTANSTPVMITDAVTIGQGPDVLALQVSEDAWDGNAQFTVSVDGAQIGGTQIATALHATGQTQTFDVRGTFAAGNHVATINFLNDAYAGSSNTDRNLFVTGASIDNNVVSAATLSEYAQGPQSFSFLAPGRVDGVTVNRSANLMSGVQTITGTESDPTQAIFLNWRASGAPMLGAAEGVQAVVDPTGAFSASVDIDSPGVPGTMFYRIGSAPTVTAWSATPS